MHKMWHGILVDAAFNNPKFLDSFRIFAEKRDESWRIVGVEFNDADLEGIISQVQAAIRKDAPFYLHLYNDSELVVIFSERIFRVTSDRSSWAPIIAYGGMLDIPSAQLDFWPNRFQDEQHYFEAQEPIG